MKFYKIISDDAFIGIGTTRDLRRFQWEHRILLICDEQKAQYIQHNDLLYHDYWMHQTSTTKFKYTLANVIEIGQDEYEMLKSVIDAGEDIVLQIEPELTIEETIGLAPGEQITVDYVKTIKIKEMSSKCNQAIIAGFDIVLSDGMSHHFDLTTEDQLNLFEAAMLINQGEEAVSYHASGELYTFYSVDDMRLIIDAASRLRKYYTAYFNSLKGYVNSLTEVEAIATIQYGDQIPQEYVSDVLRTFMTEQ